MIKISAGGEYFEHGSDANIKGWIIKYNARKNVEQGRNTNIQVCVYYRDNQRPRGVYWKMFYEAEVVCD